MLTVAEALDAVRSHARRLPPQPHRLQEALGLRLAADVLADLDLPPFDKALVDGFAVRSGDAPGAGATALRVVETVYAGRTPSKPLGPGEAAEIMTGAPLPEGADAVVMVEKTSRPDADRVLISGAISPGQNRLIRGKEMRQGEVVVAAGSVLNAARIGVCASVGAAEVSALPRPVVGVVATGDEVVPFDKVPGPGQIRNSNTLLLTALAESSGCLPWTYPIVPDRPEALRQTFGEALAEADVLLVSGGVSAGQKDLVPAALEDVGVRPVFHKVRVKPGKPLWFGVGPDRGDRPPALVFGLPGNPVSGLVSFLLFVRPALAILSGREAEETTISFPLATDYRHADDRDVYRPARLVGDGTKVEPLMWSGSSDLRGAASGDGFAIFPAGERMYREGEPVGFLPTDPWRPGERSPYL
jgi:molybdopterin molybdotransferase